MLTRYPQTPNSDMGNSKMQITINQLTLKEYSKELVNQFDHLQELQQGDKKLKKIFLRIASKQNHHFIVFKDLLFTRNGRGQYMVMIPQVMNQALVQETHERFGHMGTYKVYQLLRLRYKLCNMYRTIKKK